MPAVGFAPSSQPPPSARNTAIWSLLSSARPPPARFRWRPACVRRPAPSGSRSCHIGTAGAPGWRPGALLARGLQRAFAVELARIDGQRAFRFAQCVEHGGVEAGGGGLGAGLGLAMRAWAAPVLGMVQEISGPMLQLKVPRSPNMAAGPPDAPDRPSEILGYRSAVATPMRACGGGQAAFGLADVGTATQQRGAVAHRNGLGQARRRGALQQAGGNLRRRGRSAPPAGTARCAAGPGTAAGWPAAVAAGRGRGSRPARCRVRRVAGARRRPARLCTSTECRADASCMPAAHMLA